MPTYAGACINGDNCLHTYSLGTIKLNIVVHSSEFTEFQGHGSICGPSSASKHYATIKFKSVCSLIILIHDSMHKCNNDISGLPIAMDTLLGLCMLCQREVSPKCNISVQLSELFSTRPFLLSRDPGTRPGPQPLALLLRKILRKKRRQSSSTERESSQRHSR